jgi:hypothetical protein
MTIKFDRKPQRYLKNRENVTISDFTFIGQWKAGTTVAVTMKMVINNPYGFEAFPLIIVSGGQALNTGRAWLQIKETNYDTATSDEFSYDQSRTAFFIRKNLSNGGRVAEIDSEKRSFVNIGDESQSESVVIVHSFPTIKPGINYYYFTVANTINVIPPSIDYTKINSPIIYPRWWTI